MIPLKENDLFAEHYRLKRKLGKGSFGEVWLARNNLADIDVAIKIYCLLDDNGIMDFRKEFRIAYKLHHPNLLHLNHFDVFEQHPFLVMPYCAKGSSAAWAGKMSERQIWHFIRDVSCGLAFLHSQTPPIIHQDIKPDNILIDDNGKYLISDFGISHKLEHTFRKSTKEAISSGTLAYMGPERFSEQPQVVAASDIWSLGMSVYELLTGHVLWNGMGGCVQLNGAPLPLLDNNRYSSQLSRFVQACLSLNTWERPTARRIYDYACFMLEQNHTRPHTSFPQKERTIRPTPAKRQLPKLSKRWTGGIVIAMLLLLLCGYLISSIVEKCEEERLYGKCLKEDNIELYRQFRSRYPHSFHIKSVDRMISLLEQDSLRRAKVQKEEKTEDTVTPPPLLVPEKIIPKSEIDTSDEKIYTPEFLPVNPIDPDSESEEELMFLNCITISDYQHFIQTYPKSKFKYDAQKIIREMESGKMPVNPARQIIWERKHTSLKVGIYPPPRRHR